MLPPAFASARSCAAFGQRQPAQLMREALSATRARSRPLEVSRGQSMGSSRMRQNRRVSGESNYLLADHPGVILAALRQRPELATANLMPTATTCSNIEGTIM